jgi:lysophospholipase L1-like esterase
MAMLADSLVQAMYDGRSVTFLNNLIQGQAQHPVSTYLREVDQLLWNVAAVVVLISTLALVLEITRCLRTDRLSLAISALGIIILPVILGIAGIMMHSSVLKQSAMLLFIACLALAIALFLYKDEQERVFQAARSSLLGIIAFTLIFFFSGELMLRFFFASGESFGSRVGPIASRFEQDFVFNRFDGPSRGPDISEQIPRGKVRILIQGDSITWGQGIRDEQSLFSFQLLELLRKDKPGLEIAVLAQPGREIDGHLAQLEHWGELVAPDIIVYQFFANDMELDRHQGRPVAPGRYWRRLFFHRFMVSYSYLWFFLDYELDQLLPGTSQTYEDYLTANYSPGTAGWAKFVDTFQQWLAQARQLTPNILVALYPVSDGSGNRRLTSIYDAVEKLCKDEGIDTIDLWDELSTLAVANDLYASRFDGHPGEAAHGAIAGALYEKLHASDLINAQQLP